MGLDGLTLDELEQQLRDAQEFASTAEDHKRRLEDILKRRRHAHATIDGIEEAIGLCVSILHDEELASLLRAEKFRRLREVLDKVRVSPTSYRDEDRRTLPGLREWMDGYEEFARERRRTSRA